MVRSTRDRFTYRVVKDMGYLIQFYRMDCKKISDIVKGFTVRIVNRSRSVTLTLF